MSIKDENINNYGYIDILIKKLIIKKKIEEVIINI